MFAEKFAQCPDPLEQGLHAGRFNALSNQDSGCLLHPRECVTMSLLQNVLQRLRIDSGNFSSHYKFRVAGIGSTEHRHSTAIWKRAPPTSAGLANVVLFRHDLVPPGRAGDYSNEGQQPSSSWRPVRCWQVLSNSRCPTSFQTARGPASRTASAFWISTARPQRRHATRSRCRCMYVEQPLRPDRGAGRSAVRCDVVQEGLRAASCRRGPAFAPAARFRRCQPWRPASPSVWGSACAN